MENQALEEIAAAIAHEVKNPLTLVRFNLDILESSDQRMETHKNYAMIRKELKKINDLIMDFIYLTENNYGEKDKVQIDGLLHELKEDMQTAMPDVTFEVTCLHKGLTVDGYESSIKTLFGNIVKNAVEAMDFKGKLQVKAEKKGEIAEIIFKDNGPGLIEGVSDKMFKEHFTSKPMGSGLGLSICKKIAKEHGGDFTLKNAKDGGCIATVKLQGLSR